MHVGVRPRGPPPYTQWMGEGGLPVLFNSYYIPRGTFCSSWTGEEWVSYAATEVGRQRKNIAPTCLCLALTNPLDRCPLELDGGVLPSRPKPLTPPA